MIAYFDFVTYVEHVNYSIGMLLSFVLLYCIIFCNRLNLGNYRYLQMILVLVDVTHTTGQCLIRERFVARDQMFVMVSTGIVNDAMKAYFEFVTHVEHFNYAIGMFLSSMLFYCIIYCNNSSLGMYRYLQMIIVLVDATHTTVQCFLRERFVARDRMFVMVSTGIVNDARVLCSYASVYTVIFVLDDYSFLYRLWTLKYPQRVQKFSQPSFVFGLFSFAILELCVWFSVSYNCFAPSPSGKELLFHELSENFNVDSRERAMIMAECLNGDGTFKGRTLLGITVCLSFIGSCMTFMLYAIRSIYIFLKSANLMSKNLLRMQKQLFLTLCLQTLIPFFALYVSAGAFMILPLFAIEAVWVANLAPLLISFFLPLDALVVLTDYRREVVRMIWRSKPEVSQGVFLVSHMPTKLHFERSTNIDLN